VNFAGQLRSANMNQATQMLDRKAAAEFLGIKEQTLAVWACTKRYDLPFIKIGRRVMYLITDLVAFINRNRVGGV